MLVSSLGCTIKPQFVHSPQQHPRSPFLISLLLYGIFYAELPLCSSEDHGLASFCLSVHGVSRRASEVFQSFNHDSHLN